MHTSNRSIAILCLVFFMGGGAITGCSEKTEMTKQEDAAFKSNSGQMPPEAAAAIAKQRAAAQSKMGASGAPAESVPGGAK